MSFFIVKSIAGNGHFLSYKNPDGTTIRLLLSGQELHLLKEIISRYIDPIPNIPEPAKVSNRQAVTSIRESLLRGDHNLGQAFIALTYILEVTDLG